MERNDGTIGDTTLLPIHLTFVELTLGKFTDGVGVLLASVLRFRTNCVSEVVPEFNFDE